jgi:hypothetical protein
VDPSSVVLLASTSRKKGLDVTLLRRHVQRRGPVLRGLVDLDALVREQEKRPRRDLSGTRLSAPWPRPPPNLLVDLDALMCEQEPHHLDVTVPRREHQRRAASRAAAPRASLSCAGQYTGVMLPVLPCLPHWQLAIDKLSARRLQCSPSAPQLRALLRSGKVTEMLLLALLAKQCDELHRAAQGAGGADGGGADGARAGAARHAARA